jgi:hypothetical protein
MQLQLKMTMVVIGVITLTAAGGCGRKPTHRQADPPPTFFLPPSRPAHPDPALSVRETMPATNPESALTVRTTPQPAAPAVPPLVWQAPPGPPVVTTTRGPVPVVSAELADQAGEAARVRSLCRNALEQHRSLADIVAGVEDAYEVSAAFADRPALARQTRLWRKWADLTSEMAELVMPINEGVRSCSAIARDCRAGHVEWPDARRALLGRYEANAEELFTSLPRKYRDLDKIAEQLGVKLPSWQIKPLRPVPRSSSRPVPHEED